MLYTIATPNDINQLIQMRLAFIYDDFKKFDIEKRTQIAKQLPKYFNKHLGYNLYKNLGFIDDTSSCTLMKYKF